MFIDCHKFDYFCLLYYNVLTFYFQIYCNDDFCLFYCNVLTIYFQIYCNDVRAWTLYINHKLIVSTFILILWLYKSISYRLNEGTNTLSIDTRSVEGIFLATRELQIWFYMTIRKCSKLQVCNLYQAIYSNSQISHKVSTLNKMEITLHNAYEWNIRACTWEAGEVSSTFFNHRSVILFKNWVLILVLLCENERHIRRVTIHKSA